MSFLSLLRSPDPDYLLLDGLGLLDLDKLHEVSIGHVAAYREPLCLAGSGFLVAPELDALDCLWSVTLLGWLIK